MNKDSIRVTVIEEVKKDVPGLGEVKVFMVYDIKEEKLTKLGRIPGKMIRYMGQMNQDGYFLHVEFVNFKEGK